MAMLLTVLYSKIVKKFINWQQLLDFALTSRPNLTRNPITAVNWVLVRIFEVMKEIIV
jgi:hypothetical protein